MANTYPTRGTLIACMFIALGLATPLGDASAATLGRLFFTPAQRAKLDQLRSLQRGTSPKAEAEAAEQALAEPAQAPQPVTLNGVVRRSDGSTTIWINDQMHQTGAHSSAKAADPNGVEVVLPESKRKIRLKVGQTVDPSTGAVKERESGSDPQRPSIPETPPSGSGTGELPAPQRAAAP